MDDDSNVFQAMPKKLVARISESFVPPAAGSGRIRLDLSINVWTLIALIAVLLVLAFAASDLHTQVEVLKKQAAQQIVENGVSRRRIMRLETHDLVTQRDLRLFPLHRHVDRSRVDIYPDMNLDKKHGPITDLLDDESR